MSEADVEQLLQPSEGSTGGPGQIVRHRAKVASVPNNARSVLRLILAERKAAAEQGKGTDVPEHGYFDGFLWSFVAGVPQLNRWEDRKCIPTETEVSIAMSKALKARGFSFVGESPCEADAQHVAVGGRSFAHGRSPHRHIDISQHNLAIPRGGTRVCALLQGPKSATLSCKVAGW